MTELIENNVHDFFNFMNERHAIYLRRKRGDVWPWTEDTILQTFKFTNVYRELDTGTVWCREHIIEPHWDDPELFFNVAAYRRYNYINTQSVLGYITDYDPIKTTACMMDLHEEGFQIFTGAHMLCGSIRDEDGNVPPTKVEQIFRISFKKLWDNRRVLEPQSEDSLETAYCRLLSKVPGYGPFITYEVVTDLRHTRYLNQASDIMTWANPGPGAERGIVRLMGLDVKGERSLWPNKPNQIEVMKALVQLSPDYLADWMDPLEMRDIEHSLCEYDKYERVRLNQGRPRSLFIPPHLR